MELCGLVLGSHKCAMGPVQPYYTDELSFIRRHGNFAMRRTIISLLTFLLPAGSHARAQLPGPVDPSDLQLLVLDIDGVGYELLLPTTQEC